MLYIIHKYYLVASYPIDFSPMNTILSCKEKWAYTYVDSNANFKTLESMRVSNVCYTEFRLFNLGMKEEPFLGYQWFIFFKTIFRLIYMHLLKE